MEKAKYKQNFIYTVHLYFGLLKHFYKNIKITFIIYNIVIEEDVKKIHDKTEEEYFLEYYNKLKHPFNNVDDASYKKIPRFYFKVSFNPFCVFKHKNRLQK